jgi:hypothetical protein
MNLSLSDLRIFLSQLPPSDSGRRALAILNSQDFREDELHSVRNTAREVLGIWRTREKTSALSGVVIPGVASLNTKLSKLSPETPVDQYGFNTPSSAGSIFIDPATGQFLGDTIVKRRGKSQQMLDLEAQLFSPSRKSA